MFMHLIAEARLSCDEELELCLKTVQYVALLHGNKNGRTVRKGLELPSFLDDNVSCSVHTNENFFFVKPVSSHQNQWLQLVSQIAIESKATSTNLSERTTRTINST